MGKNFYIADLHFGHHNIIRYDNRPFKSIKENDETLINNWNRVVTKDDTVYILGDYSWNANPETDVNLLRSLNGKKVLIMGNHDKIHSDAERNCFIRIKDYMEINDNGTKVILSHYPILFWNGQFRNSVHLYGHVHNSAQWNMVESWAEEARQLQALPMRIYNVGCMMKWMDYTPRTLEEIINGYNNNTK